MVLNQSIPIELILWSSQNKKTTQLRDYLRFRALAFRRGSYHSKPKWMTRRRMKELIDLGWIERINVDHYKFVSVYKIALSLGLRISVKTTIESRKCDTSAKGFRKYILSKAEAFVFRRALASAKKVRKDRDNVQQKGNVKRWEHELVLAVRYMSKVTGFGKSSISSYRKGETHNIYEKKYCEFFDNLNIKRREDVIKFVEMLAYADLSEREKDQKRNIVYDKVLKKYRNVIGTVVIFKPFSTINEFTTNSNRRVYLQRYAASIPL